VYRYLKPGEAEDIAKKAFEEAVETLKAFYKTDDYRAWLYGKIHYYRRRALQRKPSKPSRTRGNGSSC
jgi:DNA-directed RNA polymerase specialized sigma24 family protein